MSDAAYRVPEHVVHRRFDGETVVLNLATGRYHGINPTAARMLELLEEGLTEAEVARRIADEHRVPADRAAADLRDLCDALAERGLIEPR